MTYSLSLWSPRHKAHPPVQDHLCLMGCQGSRFPNWVLGPPRDLASCASGTQPFWFSGVLTITLDTSLGHRLLLRSGPHAFLLAVPIKAGSLIAQFIYCPAPTGPLARAEPLSCFHRGCSQVRVDSTEAHIMVFTVFLYNSLEVAR